MLKRVFEITVSFWLIWLLGFSGCIILTDAFAGESDGTNEKMIYNDPIRTGFYATGTIYESVPSEDSKGDSVAAKKSSTFQDDLYKILRNVIFMDTTHRGINWDKDIKDREAYFKRYEDRTIENIYINKLPPFGATIDKPFTRDLTALEKFGNSLHINTRDQIILQNLFFEEEDPVEAYLLADNERILRRLPYIRDARIIILPTKNDEEVDVLVVTRDVFSIGVSVNPHSIDDMSFSLYDRNLLGYGWNFRNTIHYRTDKDPKYGYEGKFEVINIYGSFIGGLLSYMNTYQLEQGRMSFSKAYLTVATKYAGGVDFTRTIFADPDHDYNRTLFRSIEQDFWFGRSWLIADISERQTLRTGIRYYKRYYDRRPEVAVDSNVVYHHQKLYLVNLVYNRVKYFASRLIRGFGRTEDIPVGFSVELTAGLSDEEFKDRGYMGGELRAAKYFDTIGYLSAIGRIGSYHYKSQWEDGLFGLSLSYFSPLIPLDNFRFRQFLVINYTRGINRYDAGQIDIEDQTGIRGLRHPTLRGTERLVFQLETVSFSPWTFLGFRFAFFSFVDAGWIGPAEEPFSNNEYFSAIGLGCRIRNESLVLQTLNLRVAIYPNRPGGTSAVGFEVSTSEPFMFMQFSSGKPRILPFE